MGDQIKLKETAIAILLKELHHSQMTAIYLLSSGAKLPESVSKTALAKIICTLCIKLNWTRKGDENCQNNSAQTTIKLKETAIATLLEELHPSQMIAIYMMSSGA